jgi:hypothetical protein
MRYLGRPVAILLLVWYLPACARYQPIELTPEEVFSDEDRLIVTLRRENGDTYQLQLRRPWATTDSIGGIECSGICDSYQRWATPLEKVESVEKRQVDSLRSAAVVLGVLGLAALAAMMRSIDKWVDDAFGEP